MQIDPDSIPGAQGAEGCACCQAQRALDQADRAAKQAPQGDDFAEQETDAATALTDAVAERGAEARQPIDRALDDNGDVETAVDEAAAIMAGVFALAETDVRDATSDAMIMGEGLVLEGALDGTSSPRQVRDGLIESARLETNGYFDEHVVPDFLAKVREARELADALTPPDFTDARELLDRRLNNPGYWRVLANYVVSTSFHYGYLRAGERQGRTQFEFDAVLDERTTAICRELDGRRFPVASATALIERAAANPGAEEQVKPFARSVDDVKGKTNGQLVSEGLFIPPIHFNCRSTLRLV